MAISFDFIPSTIRVPGAYAEIDNSRALRGLLPAFQQRILVLGQRLAAGNVAAAIPTQILTADAASLAFGSGSMLHRMFKFVAANNGFTPTTAVALDDAGAGVAAVGSVKFGGVVTAAGTYNLYIGGRRVRIAVAAAEASNVTSAALAAAVQADADLAVSAAVDGVDNTKVNLTAKHKGENGNAIDLRSNYFTGESLPDGLTEVFVAMAGGSGNPDVTAALAAIGDEQYDYIVMPWTDAANLAVLEAELAARFQPLKETEGAAFSALVASNANLVTFGTARNSPHLSVMGLFDTPTPGEEIAAAYGARAALHLNIDPARPLQTLPLVGVLAPPEESRFDLQERNLLLFSGIATARPQRDGTVIIERAITTYQTNAAGAEDISYLDVNTLVTLAFLRKSWRARMLLRFPRHKLASDGTKAGPGQAIATPSAVRGETLALARTWEEAGLVENLDQFKTELIVERDIGDPNRVNLLIPPDVVNQLRVLAAKFQYIL